MTMCPACGRFLIRVDAYGEQLYGCVTCNAWVTLDGTPRKLSEADVEALRGLDSVTRRAG
jgi:hypothetical protein